MASTLGCVHDCVTHNSVPDSWPSTRRDIVLLGVPLIRTLESGRQSAPGSTFNTAYGFRRPVPDALLAELAIAKIGSAFRVSVLTLVLSSPLSVFSNGAAASTVADSVLAPTSSTASTRTTCATGTMIPGRKNFLNPGTTTVSS